MDSQQPRGGEGRPLNASNNDVMCAFWPLSPACWQASQVCGVVPTMHPSFALYNLAWCYQLWLLRSHENSTIFWTESGSDVGYIKPCTGAGFIAS